GIRPQLNMHSDRRLALTRLHMERGARAGRYPQPASFPSAIRVVDASVDPFGVHPHRIRHADGDPLAVLQREVAVGLIAGSNRRVVAEAERVALIDPREIAAFGAP